MLLDKNKGFCPWCQQGTAFRQVQEIRYASPYVRLPIQSPVAPPEGDSTGVVVFQCLHCDKSVVLLEHRTIQGLDVQGEISREMVWPIEQPRSLPASVPEPIRSFYEEASRCEKAGAMRGAGVLYRAAVEEIAKDQGAKKFSLNDKIEEIRPKLGTGLADDLQEAKLLGNDSIHQGIVYSADEIEDVAGLIEEATLTLYVQPEQKRAMRDARKRRRTSTKSASTSVT